MSKDSQFLVLMITRQLYPNTNVLKLAKQRYLSASALQRTGEAHAHHLFDENPKRNALSVNRSMVDSLRKNQPFQALRNFKMHLQTCLVDEVTLALALKACAGDPFRGSQIHGFAITSGINSHVTVSNSLMNMYCKSGQFGKALVIFECLHCCDIVSWNTVLSGFKRSEEALNFALRMRSSGVVFDAVSYTTALSFCSCQEEFVFGEQLHSCIVKSGLDCEVFVGNALISMYSRWGHMEEGRRVFEEMPNKDRVSWGAMISGYTQEGIYGLEAILMFVRMVRDGIQPDHVSFTGAISACGHDRKLEVARQMHGLSVKRGFAEHVSVGNVLMSTYTKCEVPEDAKLVFQKMVERNVVSWTTMITVNEEDAVKLFNEMRLDGVYPNDVTFIGLFSSIIDKDLVERGKMVHGFCIRTGFLSETNVSNSVITMYAKFESMEDSKKVFEELDWRETITWNALISGYTQNGLYQEAIQTFFSATAECKLSEYTFGSVLSAIASGKDVSMIHGQRCHSQLIKLGISTHPIVSNALLDMYAKRGSICDSQKVFIEAPQKTQFCWTAIISAYARHGDFDSVIYWFNEMEKQGVKPDAITFLSVLTACGRKGMVDMGRHLFDLMIQEYQIEPSSEHYSCITDNLGRAGRLEEAEELVNSIPGGPGLTVLQSLLGACRIYGNMDIGERVADVLLEMDSGDSGSYVLMSNLYAEKGQWEKVAKLRKGMREKGVRKEIGFSWVDVGDIDASLSLHGFSAGDKSHTQSEEILWMAECSGSEMKFFREKERKRWQHSPV